MKFQLDVDGVVEENDVIGAVFGQTEGLLGPLFDLREMQRVGKIGRILVKASSKKGKTQGTVSIFCNLDMPSTTLVAALVESVDQIGPYEANIAMEEIHDYRKEKVEHIVDRAKSILDSWKVESIPHAESLVKELRKHVSPPPAREVGKERIAAGPDIGKAKEIVLVEGRADVGNLLKYGIKNVLSMGGGKISKSLTKFVQGKTVTAFLDGDRGGEMNLKKLLQMIKVDYVAMAPRGKEVEDLKPGEIFEALEKKQPVGGPPLHGVVELKQHEEIIQKVNGTLEAALVDSKERVIDTVPVSVLVEDLNKREGNIVKKIIFDGIVTQRLLDAAAQKGVELIIGNRMGGVTKRPDGMNILTFGGHVGMSS